MLFNSYAFILCFLPIVWCGFFLFAQRSHTAAAFWLAAASLVFYGYWSLNYIPLLLGSIAVNYTIGNLINKNLQDHCASRAKAWLIAGLFFDLGLLAYFKYAGFFVASLVDITSWQLSIPTVILPLGISFFTFTQIAYLVDTYKGLVKERNPVHYLLFVTYFPHLIAGPILHHKQMMPQFALPQTYRINQEHIAVGLTIFTIGLFKKVILADALAEFATPVFNAATHGAVLTTKEAWVGALSYTLQLYFDFSGYSDMAIGLSRLFGIKLPLNFSSPYKSTSIIEFWRRWHMTLSQFLREYLYIALGGNRLGKIRRYLNLMLTMLLGGLWHGAGWTFVIWGGLHGIYLAINHLFRELFPLADKSSSQSHVRLFLSWLLTLFAVVIAWVFFRAHSVTDALTILKTMAGLQNLSPSPAMHVIGHTVDGWRIIVITGVLALFAPNTQEIMSNYQPAWDVVSSDTRWKWAPSIKMAVLTGLLFGLTIVNIASVSEFLYFQF